MLRDRWQDWGREMRKPAGCLRRSSWPGNCISVSIFYNKRGVGHIRCRLSGGGNGNGNDGRARDQICSVLADHSEFCHYPLEGRRHRVLLVDEALPRASSTGVAGESEVGLEAHLPDVDARAQRKGRQFFTYTLSRYRKATFRNIR